MKMERITHPKITADVVTMTPELAQALLDTSRGNRSLKVAKISSLQRDMESGRFTLNGESVIVSERGRLMDGHHRLSACVKSGATFQTILVRGIKEDTGKTQDTGASRTVADHLSLSGVKNANNLSAVVSCIMSMQNGRPRSANPSSTEVFDFVSRNPAIHDAASFAATKAFPRAANILGAIYFVADAMGEADKAMRFRDVFASGIPAYKGCPAHLLRERLNRHAIRGEKIPIQMTQRLFVAAWEKFRKGDTAKSIKAPADYKITGLGFATHS